MTRHWRAWLGVLGSFLLVPLVVLAVGSPAHACSCAVGEAEDYVEWADAVFTGNLVELDAPEPDGGDTASYGDDIAMLVAVDEVFKGEVSAQVEVGTSSGGASCGISPPPVGGDPWLWFVFKTEDGGYTASICGGSGPIAEETMAAVVDLVGPGADPEGGSTETGGADGAPGGEGTSGESEGAESESGHGDVADGETGGAEAGDDEGGGDDAAVMWGVGGLVLLLLGGAAAALAVRRRA